MHLFGLIFSLCSLCVFEIASFALPQAVENHFWRDYNGLVASDALPGGTDAAGVATFLGQFTIFAEYGFEKSEFHIIPATIAKGKDTAAAAYNGRTVYGNYTTNNLKVLCTSTASRYKWYNPTAQFPAGCRFVIVGIEDDSPLYVGKVTKGKEVLTGKIFGDTSRHQEGLIVPYEGEELLFLENYDVLTYCI